MSVGIECEEITSAEPPINVNLPVSPPVKSVDWSSLENARFGVKIIHRNQGT